MGEEWLHHGLLHKLTAVNRQLWQVVAGVVVLVDLVVFVRWGMVSSLPLTFVAAHF